jgi:hypothetical protein
MWGVYNTPPIHNPNFIIYVVDISDMSYGQQCTSPVTNKLTIISSDTFHTRKHSLLSIPTPFPTLIFMSSQVAVRKKPSIRIVADVEVGTNI